MDGERVSAKRYPPNLKFQLYIPKRFLAHTFPNDNNFIDSIWAGWVKRIQAGRDADTARIEKLAERWGCADLAGDVGDWIAEDVYNMKDLTNAMYAALVVAAWSRMEAFLKLIVRLSIRALDITTDIPYEFGKIKGFFQENMNVDLSALPEYKTVDALRILNNSFKHNDGVYRPEPEKSHTQIDETLLNRWQIVDGANRIEFSKLSIKELVVACNSFGSVLLTTTEAAIRSNLRGLGDGG